MGTLPDIDWDRFAAVEMRVGRVIEVEDFPEARKPAWKLRIDFGPEIGVKRSSAQITNYAREQLRARWSSRSSTSRPVRSARSAPRSSCSAPWTMTAS